MIRTIFFCSREKNKTFFFPRPKKNSSYHFWIPLEKRLIPINKVFRSDVNSGARGVNGAIPGYGWLSLYVCRGILIVVLENKSR